MFPPKYLLLGMGVPFESVKPDLHRLRMNTQQSCPDRSHSGDHLIRKCLVSNRTFTKVFRVYRHGASSQRSVYDLSTCSSSMRPFMFAGGCGPLKPPSRSISATATEY